MQHDFEHGLRIQLSTALRERDGAIAERDAARDFAKATRDALAAAIARADAADLALDGVVRGAHAVQAERDELKEALAAARLECEGLRTHLRRMIDWADLHVNEVEAIAASSKDPMDARRARAARAEYDFASAALGAPGDPK